jgi:CheY-like chemotaxis protein
MLGRIWGRVGGVQRNGKPDRPMSRGRSRVRVRPDPRADDVMTVQPIGSADEFWLFTDPSDRRWVLYLVPLERDATLSEEEQPKALVMTCDDGWPFVVPVGPGFAVEQLSMQSLARLVSVAEGDARQAVEWEPFRLEPRSVRDPVTGLEYRVRAVPSEEPQGVELGDENPDRITLLFNLVGGTWAGRAPLDPGTTMESLSLQELRVYLRYALERDRGAAREAVADDPGGAHEPVPATAGGVVLLVEDHSELRRIYRIALENAGYAVLDAADGDEALKLAEANQDRLRAVVSDVVLPRVGGRELFWRLSENQPGIPIILMSGLLDHAEAAAALAPAPSWFIQKPFTPELLVRLLRRVLHRVERARSASAGGDTAAGGDPPLPQR